MASKRRKGIVFSIGKAEQLRAKCPVYGCQLHVVERFNDVAIHIVNGRMASPEEGFAKQFQSWIESTAPRNHNEVKEMYRLYRVVKKKVNTWHFQHHRDYLEQNFFCNKNYRQTSQ